MFFYAQINALNEVVGVSQLTDQVSDPLLLPIGSYDESLLGKIWDGTIFTAPIPVVPPIGSLNTVSKIQFVNLFTDSELLNILTTAKSNVSVELLVMKVSLSDKIDLSDPLTITSVNMLEQNGIIGSGRANIILSNTLPP